ncbi:helix-turn-helix transcriptional regulator [Roseovarius sp. MMSF_3281]|uniref:helix-turn-helix domain-containing protein n=1 Tax=Roseovarius sp. MMSF_3281 TaxID=3046694 RepID=UPI00273FDDA1|nr:helix-turn-helix transcriptional regulator [Roseovarius sp. MMSF_3281]
MTYDEKASLARTGDTGKEAAAIRLRAARKSIGLSQPELGKKSGLTKAAISNAEAASSLPSRKVMIYLYREHRIDFNFMICGEFSQLPGDVQDRLFETLSETESGQDQTQGSGSHPSD